MDESAEELIVVSDVRVNALLLWYGGADLTISVLIV